MSLAMVEWVLEGVLVLAILAALPVAIRLERAFSALKRDGSTMFEGARTFVEATKEAEACITRLRAAADGAGRSVSDQVQAATALRDDLRFLIERAGHIADRLDTGLRATRPASPNAVSIGGANAAATGAQTPTPAGEPPVPRARAEQELLRAISRSRAS